MIISRKRGEKINYSGSVGIEASTGNFMPGAGRSIKVLKNLKAGLGLTVKTALR
jgi:hypothetical protein